MKMGTGRYRIIEEEIQGYHFMQADWEKTLKPSKETSRAKEDYKGWKIQERIGI